jgi:LacI family transcriptional regulator
MINAISKTDRLKEIILTGIKNGKYQPGEKLPSILTICKKYNVSKHTVSQTLSNLSELGIIDLAHGKATRVSKAPFKNNIEIIYNATGPIDQHEFWSEFYRGMIDEINKTPEFSFTIRMAPAEGIMEDINLTEIKKSVGALVVGNINKDVFSCLKQYGIKFLMVYNKSENDKLSYVASDFRAVIQEVVELFITNGHSKIAYVGYFGKEYPGINSNKYNIFIKTMAANGLSTNPNLHREASHQKLSTGYDAVKSLLASKQQIDGIFLSSDVLAPSVYRALYEANLTIPDDVIVVGCDNLEIGQYMIPSLTTIELSRYEMGRAAANNLITKIKNGNKIIQATFSPKLIIRESLY